MSAFRASRLSLVVASAAIVLSGCMQSTGPVAKAPRGDLDALAYGSLQDSAKPAERGFFTSRAFADASSTRATPAAAEQSYEAPPVILVADATQAKSGATAPVSAARADGLLAALGLRSNTVLDPMQSNAQLQVVYAAPPAVVRDPEYRIDSGDKLRVVVYGQEGLTNSYAIDAGGGLTMPLIGRVVARGLTPAGLAAHITARLRKGYIREPSVAVEIEAYRPFFILGEVAAPGQYPYVPNMSVEAAVAIAGGFSPRARRDSVMLTHRADGGQFREAVPLGTPLSPGDTVMVGERWF